MSQVNKVMVANRSEIAVRIIRSCREMGIKTVAVYSEADKTSLHVQLADEAISIGPAPSAKSYLNIENIIAAAKQTNADAIHPGYGFLAENDRFSDACRDNGISFIGPSGDVIRKMGNKIAARQMAMEAGVPTVPGTKEENGELDIEQIVALAQSIGYPVLLKAAAGGGGRGMKLVTDEKNLREEFLRTKAEAQAAFNDGTLYVEKYIRNARHVEVQILFDKNGNGIHLGERDCSLQRRHQKLVEEAPCPVIDDRLRKEIIDAAVAVARHVRYTSAGTIEFVVDLDEKKFYFIEMNTRVQVEHPVTELLTGVDIIKEQIRIAAGERLSVTQEEVSLRGHAIECRINAEDPAQGFMPRPGKIENVVFPAGPGVRVDSHCYPGYTVPPFYDSLLAKLVVLGRDRDEAVQRMLRALQEFQMAGLPTTVPFHESVLQDPDFINSNYNTRWVEESFLRKRGD